MNINQKYIELCYTKRIHEFYKIDQYKDWTEGRARASYKSLDEFYQVELKINAEELNQLKIKFKRFNELYTRYYNEQRKELFDNPEMFLRWYDEQNESCNYCETTQSSLYKLVEIRKGNLTLNGKTKRSKGTLEIEKLNSNIGYTYANVVLACPFCNNAKSNLISEEDWRIYFAPAMKNYLNNELLK